MGNNGSSSRDREAASSSVRSNGLAAVETGRRGWSRSFPREPPRHRDRAQPAAVRKVLPTGAVRRLRATDNGTIIHSGGTISGRRPPTLPSARDLVKRNESSSSSWSRFGERIGSASNLVERRPSRRFDRDWCRYRADPSTRSDADASPLGPKRSDSEPDLRSSPDFARSSIRDRSSPAGSLSIDHPEEPRAESRDRLERRYGPRKKYKAPAPPGLLHLPEDGAVHGPEIPNERPPAQRPHRHQHQRPKAQPPPRRSRLFKTRVESKKARVGWRPSAVGDRSTGPGSRSPTDRRPVERETANVEEDPRRPSKSTDDGKNTLRRSMSSPEFRAELIQVAKRVRDRLEFRGGIATTDGEPSSTDTTNRTRDDDTERAHRFVPGAENPVVGVPGVRASNVAGEPPSIVRRHRSLGNESGLEASRTEGTAPISRRNGDLAAENRRQSEQSRSLPQTSQSAPKTFYFGMNDGASSEPRNDRVRRPGKDLETRAEIRVRNRDGPLPDACDDTDDDEGSVVENISLKIRPTLPKKQLEIPRFSPSAAWRSLSAIEAPGPCTSTASEEMPLMFEERIERLSRPPPLFPLSLGTRSWQDKSGDSGISGDAGAANEDSPDAGTIDRGKSAATRPTWTPQQDLGEESSSDAGVDSPPPLPVPFDKCRPRGARVFSLSLPRDDTRGYLCGQRSKPRPGSAFNSLQKLKRSVSGAFGIGTHDQRKQSARDLLDDNWLLSCSAPTSLQPDRIALEPSPISPSGWRRFSSNPNNADRSSRRDGGNPRENDAIEDDLPEDEDGDGDEDRDKDADEDEEEDVDEDRDEDARIERYRSRNANDRAKDFPIVMKPPSFSYLAPAGHPMYLPEVNEAEHRAQNFIERNVPAFGSNFGYDHDYDRDRDREAAQLGETEIRVREERKLAGGRAISTAKMESEEGDNDREDEDEVEERAADGAAKRPRQTSRSRGIGTDVDVRNEASTTASAATREAKSQRRNASKGKRFTFQSTVRQIERRRLAERLSREAEAKERQRKGELEAMRKVEEEFQRKRAKEKASVRQRLRLYKEMEENFDSLPTLDWDGGSQMSRAEPDGAASSTASSPISMPSGKKDAVRGSESKEQKSCRPKYYDWSPDTGSHSDCRQTTVHPKVVCDIPKSSAVFVDANVHSGKPATSGSTPRSGNYRKDFAHGTRAAKTCFASSDSELSQSNARPHSRQNGPKGDSHRARSGSPGHGKREDAASSEEEDAPAGLPTTHPTRNPVHDFLLSGVQPFAKRKAYRPISFNPPQSSTPIPS